MEDKKPDGILDGMGLSESKPDSEKEKPGSKITDVVDKIAERGRLPGQPKVKASSVLGKIF